MRIDSPQHAEKALEPFPFRLNRNGALEWDEMKVVAARDVAAFFLMPRMHYEILRFRMVRSPFLLCMGLFSQFSPRPAHHAVGASRRGKAIQLQTVML
jgi:hypothetical protein